MSESRTSSNVELDAKEEAIIEAARRVFLAGGFDGASMDVIALKANVSKRTVYNRFKSKEALFAATIDESCRNILPVDTATLEANLSPRDFVDRIAHAFMKRILDPDTIALRRIATFEAHRRPDLGVTYFEHGPLAIVDVFAPMLARTATRAGILIPDPRKAIWQLGALITEPLYTRVLLGESIDNLEQAIDDQIASGLDAFWKIYA